MKVHGWTEHTQRSVSAAGPSLTARVPGCRGDEVGVHVGGGGGRGGAVGANDEVPMLDDLLVVLVALDLSAAGAEREEWTRKGRGGIGRQA
jgi:hypothetical protein